MEIKLTVSVSGMHTSAAAAAIIPELVRECFDPVDVNTEPHIFDGVSEERYRTVVKMREDAAEILSKQITEMIISAMSEKDTRDGYPNGT